MPVIRTIRRDLGLSTGDLLVLGALLSFLPCKDRETGVERPIGPDMVLVVFAGNAALCDRANGMDERSLRRHLSRLSDAGLIRRKQSATGKRFPLKRDGLIRDAFGIDLTPLLERHEQLTEMADEVRRQAEELRSLRAEALALRAEAIDQVDPADADARSFLDHVKTVLRRATLTIDLVRSLIADLLRRAGGSATSAPCPPRPADPGPAPTGSVQMSSAPSSTPTTSGAATRPQVSPRQRSVPVEGPRSRPDLPPSATSRPSHKDRVLVRRAPDKTSAENGQIVRQQDPSQIDLKKRKEVAEIRALWGRCELVEMAFPEPPENDQALLRVIYDFGRLAQLDERILAEAVHQLGTHRLVEVLDYIARNAASIRCRYSYLSKIMLRKAHETNRISLPHPT